MKNLSCFILLTCCATLGCSAADRGPERASIHGTVTVDGVPVEEGMVQFTPIEGNVGPVTGSVVKNGEYATAKAKGPVVGMNRVEILGNRKTGRMIQTRFGPAEERESVVPERYSKDSTLVREVKSGKNEFNFQLSSEQ